jgi:hypothetical protein
MDGYQFFASLFQSLVSLAWPAALIVCVWLFRTQLAGLLPNLRVKHKDWEISFRLGEAEKAAAKLPALTNDSREAPPTPEEKTRFQQIAKLSPRAAILEMRATLEEAVRSFANAMGMADANPYGYASLIRSLRKNDLIDANTSALLDDLRAIGNAAAHNQSDPTEQDALRFGELTERLVWQLGIASGASKMPPAGPIVLGP